MLFVISEVIQVIPDVRIFKAGRRVKVVGGGR
jgi:hypothetical protein